MDYLQEQLNKLKVQQKEDFKFTMVALDNVIREMNTVRTKMASQEERFESILDIVQKMLNEVRNDHVKQADLAEIRARLEALEKRIDSAA